MLFSFVMCSLVTKPQSPRLLCVANHQPSSSHLLCSASHPPYTSALHCGITEYYLSSTSCTCNNFLYTGFSSSLLSLPNANRNKGSSPLPYHEIDNVIVNPAAKSSSRTSHAVLDSSWNFLATKAEKDILLVVILICQPRRLFLVFTSATSTQASPKGHPTSLVWTFASPSRHPRRLRLAVFAILAVFASPSSPSSPRHPRRLRLAILAVFASPSSPRRRRLAVFVLTSSSRHPRHAILALPSLLAPGFSSSPSSWNVAFLGPAALFCPMVDHPWGGAVALRLRAP
ncbi:hypothetical protein OUZ56_022308 [Daphnia magna]|uniref:Uncharacterized protein n=1 Tax=Daphnia magna TaxID=35525 RepID=A0ABR0AW28_9CRUS|nr:hypothetical protein OUZ56_022308 [Daphnia magna]